MRVLLANDASKHSHAAAEYLLALPFRKPIDLDIASAVMPPVFMDMGSLGVPDDLTEFINEECESAKERVAKTAEELGGPVHKVQTHVSIGQPSHELLSLADELDADLIVMGAVGHSALDRVLLGSVSDYVATHSETSTLVVRPRRDSDIPPKLEKIAIALSGSPEDQRMIDWLKQFHLHPSIEVHLVRVLRLDTFYRQDIRRRASKFWDGFVNSAQAQILELETQLQSMGLTTETHLVESDHVGDALINYAETHGCDLLVTGDSDSGILTRVFIGSTSRYVLRHAECSVLIVRDREDRARAKESVLNEPKQVSASAVS
ncbi:universal stress protein [Rhodopirellula sp. SWK7]|uniref:universal stress protein n=1 Tax=Rhodopirellula sp. SWK7 TaxID=595460 RepID=UPI0002BDAAF0|nr:universal stress protein [Rhodopirellula sp. SWK7]EMI46495.1 universal stress protein [Rhodopirellula sp. SWK7]